MSENAITIVGNLTRPPELRFTANGAAVATLGVAVNRRRKQGEEWIEETSFFDVTCWKEMAECASESLNQGDRVIVTGRLEQRTWEDKEGGKRSKVEIVADDIGPSLRWATATVQKVEKGGTAGRPVPAQGGHPARRTPEPPFGSEEPF